MANMFRYHLSKLNLTSIQHYKHFLTGTRMFASHKSFQKPHTRFQKPQTRFQKPQTRFQKPQTRFQNPRTRFQNQQEVVDETPVKRKHPLFPLYQSQPLTLAPKRDTRPTQKFDYFLVLDFEATCDSPGNLDPQEIIEFPVLKVHSGSFKIESIFHSYVRPELNPTLTPFCTELTGVIQSMVDDQPLFKEVFEKFEQWLSTENILRPGIKFAFVTCGDPDLEYLLPLQCGISDIEVPEYMKMWINVKRSFCEVSPYTWPDNLVHMLKMCELEHSGDLHSGIDDAKNVAKVMENLADRGLVFDINGWIKRR